MIQLKEEKRILLDGVEINWTFTFRETLVFQMMWRANENVETIAKKLKRPMLEIGLLIIEQAELENIEVRRHGLF